MGRNRTLPVALLLGACAVAAGEEPKIAMPDHPGPAATVAETVLAPPPTPGAAVGQQHMFGAQIQFGRPTGTRVQYAVFRGGDYSILAEAFGGAKAAFWGDEGVVGLGARAMFNATSDGVRNALVIGPGVGVSYWQAPPRPDYVPQPYYYGPYGGYYVPPAPKYQSDQTFLVFDTNIGWLHDLSPDLGWELGLNVGVRIGLSGHEEGGASISGKVTGGTVGVYTGFRY